MADGDYERGARVGLGIKMAQEAALAIVARLPGTGQELAAAYSELMDSLVPLSVTRVIETQVAFADVPAAFPGAQAIGPRGGVAAAAEQPVYVGGEPTYTQPPVQYVQPQPAPPAGYPQAIPTTAAPMIPGAAQPSSGNKNHDLWRLFVADPSAWEPVVKKNANSPDFKHRSMAQPDKPQYKQAIWLKDAPEDVKPTLRMMGLPV